MPKRNIRRTPLRFKDETLEDYINSRKEELVDRYISKEEKGGNTLFWHDAIIESDKVYSVFKEWAIENNKIPTGDIPDEWLPNNTDLLYKEFLATHESFMTNEISTWEAFREWADEERAEEEFEKDTTKGFSENLDIINKIDKVLNEGKDGSPLPHEK